MRRLEAIILAGGSGSRFGGGKLLEPYRGGSLIDGAVRAAAAAPVEGVLLVTGYDGDAVAQSVDRLVAREALNKTFKRVHADKFAEGMAATLRAGVEGLSNETDAAFVFLGDMPIIPMNVAATLAQNLGQRAAAAPIFNGKRGHPVLFAARLFPKLSDLRGDHGARSILDALGDDLALITVNDVGVLFDVDHRSDLRP